MRASAGGTRHGVQVGSVKCLKRFSCGARGAWEETRRREQFAGFVRERGDLNQLGGEESSQFNPRRPGWCCSPPLSSPVPSPLTAVGDLPHFPQLAVKAADESQPRHACRLPSSDQWDREGVLRPMQHRGADRWRAGQPRTNSQPLALAPSHASRYRTVRVRTAHSKRGLSTSAGNIAPAPLVRGLPGSRGLPRVLVGSRASCRPVAPLPCLPC